MLIAWLTLLFHVQVFSCWSGPSWMAGEAFDSPVAGIHLRHRYAVLLKKGLPDVDRQTAYAVFILAHELGHHRARSRLWLASEWRATKWAKRHWNYVVRQLGGSPATARLLWSQVG